MPSTLEHIIARLKSQMSRGEPILFTGAGFSSDASDIVGRKLPSSQELAAEFWSLASPSQEFEAGTSLGDAFYCAKSQNPNGLRQLVAERLSVSSSTLPDYYSTWFSAAWARCYTLNVDDLEIAVAHRGQEARAITSISATSAKRQGEQLPEALEVVHLNGAVWDDIGKLTFSLVDYAARQVSPDRWLTRCINDVVTRPVVFVGTELNEPTLWQYLEYRRTKGGRGASELRPGSILVCPNLNPARRVLLSELHVDWVQMSAEQFAIEILAQLRTSFGSGIQAHVAKQQSDQRTVYPALVSDLLALTDLSKTTDYLVGLEPDWSDLVSGRAIERDCDSLVLEAAEAVVKGESDTPVVITGTAGSGKSTSLMRLALRLAAKGVKTYWIDERSNIDVHRLRDVVVGSQEPVAILIDDADLFGRNATIWARDLPGIRPKVLVAVAIRASKVDGLLDSESLGGVTTCEISMPSITDSDIERLIEVLDQANRLGILKGRNHRDRVDAFRRQAERQLLVAMYQATSGLRFVEKAVDEFRELPVLPRLLYGVIAFVYSQRFTLTLDEVLTAVNSRDNETLNTLETLVNRIVIVRDDKYSGYRARHRMLADQVVNSQEFRSQARIIIEGVCSALASSLIFDEPRSSRKWRRFTRFISHDFLQNFASPDDARRIYASVEGLLEWDHHYWLQRGSLEVEVGDIALAENYLGQAKSLAVGDRYVDTEWAYLLMKKASNMYPHTESQHWFNEGYDMLLAQLEDYGKLDSYPYHVLGSQTIAWSRTAHLGWFEKRQLLKTTLDLVAEGTKRHPRSELLLQLHSDIRSEWLLTAVSE